MKTREVLAACFIVFTAMLSWPLLTIANRRLLVHGVPGLVVYLFAIWVAIVAVLVWAARRSRREGAP